MANIPGTSGPVDYPNRPEGAGGNMGGPALPAGSARAPEEAPTSPGPQQGAGSGSGGLYPNPGESTSGTIQKGYKGDSYVQGGSGLGSPQNEGNEFVTGGQNGSSAGVLGVPTTFTDV